MIEKDIVQFLRDLARKYHLQTDEEAYQKHDIRNDTELAFFIQDLFPGRTTGYLLEQGIPPDEFYPSLIESYAEITGKEFEPGDLVVSSNDDWQTADVSFVHNTEAISFKIDSVENSDWVSSEFGSAMAAFAETHLAGTWVEFTGEDWCTALYIPKAAKEDFTNLRRDVLKVDLDKVVEICREGDPHYHLTEILFDIDDINKTDSRGELALNAAIKAGKTDILWKLSEQGRPCLNPHAKNADGKTSFDIANELGLEEVWDTLNDYADTWKWWCEQQKK